MSTGRSTLQFNGLGSIFTGMFWWFDFAGLDNNQCLGLWTVTNILSRPKTAGENRPALAVSDCSLFAVGFAVCSSVSLDGKIL